jgi:hypothetical protein
LNASDKSVFAFPFVTSASESLANPKVPVREALGFVWLTKSRLVYSSARIEKYCRQVEVRQQLEGVKVFEERLIAESGSAMIGHCRLSRMFSVQG